MLARTLAALLVLLSFVPSIASAQATPRMDFRTGFSKGLELGDQKMMDSWLKKDGCAVHAALYFEELYSQKLGGNTENDAKVDALKASWERCFEKGQTLEKLQRWCDGMQTTTYATLQKGRSSSARLWEFAVGLQAATRGEHVKVMQQFFELARAAESLGHNIEAAELWGLAAVVGNKIPDKTLEDRKEALFATQQFLDRRKDWEFTFDAIYVQSNEFAKAEKARIADAEKAGDKRKTEGYDPDAKGIDALLVVGAKDDAHTLQYEAQVAWENELDYGPKNGPVPALWWQAQTLKEGSSAKLAWFRARDIHMVRTGAQKFAMTIDPADPKKAIELDVGQKGKPTTFFLDADKKVPYTMFFWAGSDKEKVGEADHNLMASTEVANVYYRSAASWKTTIGTELLTLYDDNANGTPCDADVMEPPFKTHTVGDHDGPDSGTVVPLFDSMRIGKGPRMPYSEFVKLAGGWFHLRKTKADEIALRPLNPEYYKVGKVKLVWSGPKPSAPVQLVLRGSGDYKTAYFDVAGGKEVELPAGQWTVIFGRIIIGKGARTQMATIYQGKSEPLIVEPGKVMELKMGAPFSIQWTRRGDENTTIDALQILLREASGCILTDLHGMGLAPEVFAAKAEDGKGAKLQGKFVHFTDPELVNQASKKHVNLGLQTAFFPMPEGYRSGEMSLKVKLATAGMKLQLLMKKHALFGELKSVWQ